MASIPSASFLAESRQAIGCGVYGKTQKMGVSCQICTGILLIDALPIDQLAPCNLLLFGPDVELAAEIHVHKSRLRTVCACRARSSSRRSSCCCLHAF